MHSADVERFKRQKEEIEANGFFIMNDGKRSCDVAAPVKKASALAAKAVKTRDRGTQTLKVLEKANKRPVSQEMAAKDTPREKRPAGSQQVS